MPKPLKSSGLPKWQPGREICHNDRIIFYRFSLDKPITKDTMANMNTNFCYSGITWKVYRYSHTLVGYVVASSQYQAQILAKEKFGDFVWIERVRCLG
jgi:hypothetical protein